jgi:hypothetical protein
LGGLSIIENHPRAPLRHYARITGSVALILASVAPASIQFAIPAKE